MYNNTISREQMEKYSDILKGVKKFNPRAVALFGSYGMSLQDKYSHDVDVVVYVDRIPNAKAKEAVFSSFSDNSIPTISLPYDVDIFARKQEF